MIDEPDATREAGGLASGPAPTRLSPATFRAIVSYVLAVGVSVSAAVIALGFVLAIAFGWQTSLAGRAPGPSDLADFSAMPSGLTALRPSAITQLGLALLLMTPVARVAASVVGFAFERDRLYVAITLLVLAILLGSIFLIR